MTASVSVAPVRQRCKSTPELDVISADMIAHGIAELRPSAGAIVMIQNVGNLVCSPMFDLGEHAKVVILSVTEREDKRTSR